MRRAIPFVLLYVIGHLSADSSNLPVVLWHGMGDSCCNPKSMGRIELEIKTALNQNDLYIKSIKLGETEDDDKNNGFFGIASQQIEFVCQELSSEPELSKGFNIVGFSQGGLFSRVLVQSCPTLKVNNLITIGAPHGGVSDIPGCKDNFDFKCQLMRSIVQNGVYLDWVQKKIIQAQYYKDPTNIALYFEKSIFLPIINNEGSNYNISYVENLNKINKFVMAMFDEDDMITPKETAWFDYVDENGVLIPLRHQEIYNTLGLNQLDQDGKLSFITFHGRHLQVSEENFRNEIILPYLKNGLGRLEL